MFLYLPITLNLIVEELFIEGLIFAYFYSDIVVLESNILVDEIFIGLGDPESCISFRQFIFFLD